MVTVWFLIALIALPGDPALKYKGYYAYHTKEACEMQRPSLENFIVDMELRRGHNPFNVQTYCLEMQAFEDQLRKYEKENQRGVTLGGESVGA